MYRYRQNLMNSSIYKSSGYCYRISQTESGRSMIEMLGVLAIIGVLSVGGIAGFRAAMDARKANETTNRIMKRAVVVSSQRMVGQMASLRSFDTQDGEYTIPNEVNTETEGKFVLTVNAVPQVICEKIKDLEWKGPVIGPDTCDVSNNMTFTFNNDLSVAGSVGEGQCTHGVDTNGVCRCEAGWSGEDCATKDLTCSGNGSYFSGQGCECENGYFGENCEIDGWAYCSYGGIAYANGSNGYTSGGYATTAASPDYCSCWDGYFGANCEINGHEYCNWNGMPYYIDENGWYGSGGYATTASAPNYCYCFDGYYGSTCSSTEAPCAFGEFVNGWGCSCWDGYFGENCEIDGFAYCSYGGNAYANGYTSGGYATTTASPDYCSCWDGYYGSTCSSTEAPCSGQGTPAGEGGCYCEWGYFGANCEINGFAYCNFQGYAYTDSSYAYGLGYQSADPPTVCWCDEGYFGPTCDSTESPCAFGEYANGWGCSCWDGYFGANCEIDGFAYCSFGGNAYANGYTSGGYATTTASPDYCSCWDGYFGSTCDSTESPCAFGEFVNGWGCSCWDGYFGANCEINGHEYCNWNGTPYYIYGNDGWYGSGGYAATASAPNYCYCFDGYYGSTCSSTEAPCYGNGEYIDGWGCSCWGGYFGANCEMNGHEYCHGNGTPYYYVDENTWYGSGGYMFDADAPNYCACWSGHGSTCAED